jgi:hypothetical protein
MGLYWDLISKVSGLTRRKPKVGSARDLVIFSDSYIVEHFARLGYAVSCDQLVFTLETVEDYAEAREHVWHRPGHVAAHDAGGLLVVEDAQPHATQPTRDIVVVSLGDARVVMGVIDRHGRNRFAEAM